MDNNDAWSDLEEKEIIDVQQQTDPKNGKQHAAPLPSPQTRSPSLQPPSLSPQPPSLSQRPAVSMLSSWQPRPPCSPPQSSMPPSSPLLCLSRYQSPLSSAEPPRPSTSKAADVYLTPPKKTPSGKRRAEPSTWKRNVRKQLKLEGKEYISSTGKTVKAKGVQKINCRCKLKCDEQVNEMQRQAIFDVFYSLGSSDRQRDFVCRHVEEKKTRTYIDENGQPVKKKEQVVRTFSLTIDGNKVPVCKRFFQATLDIGHCFIQTSTKNSKNGKFIGEDKRGRHKRSNKTSEESRTRAPKPSPSPSPQPSPQPPSPSPQSSSQSPQSPSQLPQSPSPSPLPQSSPQPPSPSPPSPSSSLQPPVPTPQPSPQPPSPSRQLLSPSPTPQPSPQPPSPSRQLLSPSPTPQPSPKSPSPSRQPLSPSPSPQPLSPSAQPLSPSRQPLSPSPSPQPPSPSSQPPSPSPQSPSPSRHPLSPSPSPQSPSPSRHPLSPSPSPQSPSPSSQPPITSSQPPSLSSSPQPPSLSPQPPSPSPQPPSPSPQSPSLLQHPAAPVLSSWQPRPPCSPPQSSMSSSSPLLTLSRYQSPLSSADPPRPSTSKAVDVYLTPPKKTLPGKRRAKPSTWKKNVRKQLKLEGKEYISSRGKTVKAKGVQKINCRCKLKCSEQVNEMQRQAIFDVFYSLGSYNRQRDFVCRHVDETETRTYIDENGQPVKKKRQVVRTFSFTIDGNKVPVCKRFFQATLDIGHCFIVTTTKNSKNSKFIGEDKRGRHKRSNKKSEESRTRAPKPSPSTSPQPPSPSPQPPSPTPQPSPQSPSPQPTSPLHQPPCLSPQPTSPLRQPPSPSPQPTSPLHQPPCPSPQPTSPLRQPPSPSPQPTSPSPQPPFPSPQPTSPSPQPPSQLPQESHQPPSPSTQPPSPSPQPQCSSSGLPSLLQHPAAPVLSSWQPRPPCSPPQSSMSSSSPLLTLSRYQSPLSSADPPRPSTSKAADVYLTPPKKTLPRKRRAKPSTWKKNVRKQLKLEGKEYISSRGKTVKAKGVQKINCRCKLKCSEQVNEMQRQAIFDVFYSLGSHNRQRDFVCRHVDNKETRRYVIRKGQPVKKKRKVVRKFSLTIDGNKILVCKRFFQATLDIGHCFIVTSTKNSKNGKFIGEDKRGRYKRSNKTSEESRTRTPQPPSPSSQPTPQPPSPSFEPPSPSSSPHPTSSSPQPLSSSPQPPSPSPQPSPQPPSASPQPPSLSPQTSPQLPSPSPQGPSPSPQPPSPSPQESPQPPSPSPQPPSPSPQESPQLPSPSPQPPSPSPQPPSPSPQESPQLPSTQPSSPSLQASPQLPSPSPQPPSPSPQESPQLPSLQPQSPSSEPPPPSLQLPTLSPQPPSPLPHSSPQPPSLSPQPTSPSPSSQPISPSTQPSTQQPLPSPQPPSPSLQTPSPSPQESPQSPSSSSQPPSPSLQPISPSPKESPQPPSPSPQPPSPSLQPSPRPPSRQPSSPSPPAPSPSPQPSPQSPSPSLQPPSPSPQSPSLLQHPAAPVLSSWQPRPPCSPPQSSMSSSSPLLTLSRYQSPLSSADPPRPSTSKAADVYLTPPKKTLPRKRRAKPSTWKKNVRKQLKLEGKEYISSRGKTVKAKGVQKINCRCKLKCSEQVNEMQRQAIFDVFYSLGSYNRQRDFVCRHVEEKKTRTYIDENGQPVKKKRKVVRTFSFTIDGNKIPVCMRFFQATLDIGHCFIVTTTKNSKNGKFIGEDKRGRHKRPNKTSEVSRTRVKRHIESFPAVESHYCRQSSRRKFLNSTLNVNKMYELYCDLCKDEGIEPVSRTFYREIFNTQYDLDFHKPRKGLCLVCTRYLEDKRAGELTEEREIEYHDHMKRKVESREEEAKDKELSKQREDVHCIMFDLEAVLPTPCSTVSQGHYKRKLAVYNLNVFSLSDKEATCYLWDETEGNKGSCETATCLFRYIDSLPKCVKHVILYSGTCDGQNRNKFVAAALNYMVKHFPNIEIIDQKFLESGHCHMEWDYVHATIEKAKKNLQIFIPEMWHPVIQTARSSSHPYTLDVLEHNDFYDFKKVALSSLRNTGVDTEGKQVNWPKIKWIRYTKTEEDTLFFKYRMTEPFKRLQIKGDSQREKKGMTVHELPRRYDRRLEISDAKKRDLLELCEMGIVPEKHHNYYISIPCSSSIPDRLPEPDRTESADSDDE